jgi:hypothetical protein
MSRTIRGALLGLTAVGAVFAAQPAAATALVWTRADAEGGQDIQRSWDDPSLAGSPYLSARSFADNDGASGQVYEGNFPDCALPAICFYAVDPPSSTARAQANGNTGTLRVGVGAGNSESEPGDTQAMAEARLTDQITFLGAPTMSFHLDINELSLFASGGNAQYASAMLEFEIGLTIPDAGVDGTDLWVSAFYFGGFADGAEGDYYITRSLTGEEQGSGIPSFIEGIVDFSLLFHPMFPPILEVYLRAEADCLDTTGCRAVARADQSLHLGIAGPYTSASGYSYLGTQQQPEDPPTEVPEPASALLLLGGLAGLAWWRRSATGATAAA